MIWNKPLPRLGDRRMVTHFAFLPCRVGDDIVWLQKYYSAQSFNPSNHYHPQEGSWSYYTWSGTGKIAYTADREAALKSIAPKEDPQPPKLHVIK